MNKLCNKSVFLYLYSTLVLICRRREWCVKSFQKVPYNAPGNALTHGCGWVGIIFQHYFHHYLHHISSVPCWWSCLIFHCFLNCCWHLVPSDPEVCIPLPARQYGWWQRRVCVFGTVAFQYTRVYSDTPHWLIIGNVTMQLCVLNKLSLRHMLTHIKFTVEPCSQNVWQNTECRMLAGMKEKKNNNDYTIIIS